MSDVDIFKANDMRGIYLDQLDELDGVTMTYPDWRFSVRPSNSEPLPRLNSEADTRTLMEQKRDAALRVM